MSFAIWPWSDNLGRVAAVTAAHRPYTPAFSRSKDVLVEANISAMHHCRRRVSYGARITNGGEGVESGREPLVSWCLVPFSRALIIRIDRASFRAKTCLNSAAATGSSALLLPCRAIPFHRIEGCKRQATDLLVRDFYLALDTIVGPAVRRPVCHLRYRSPRGSSGTQKTFSNEPPPCSKEFAFRTFCMRTRIAFRERFETVFLFAANHTRRNVK